MIAWFFVTIRVGTFEIRRLPERAQSCKSVFIRRCSQTQFQLVMAAALHVRQGETGLNWRRQGNSVFTSLFIFADLVPAWAGEVVLDFTGQTSPGMLLRNGWRTPGPPPITPLNEAFPNHQRIET
jgi:hypothetical protein